MNRPGFLILLGLAAWTLPLRSGIDRLPEGQRPVSESGRYLYLVASVESGKKFFSISSVSIKADGVPGEVYSKGDLPGLVEDASSQTYIQHTESGNPDSPVRGIAGKLGGQATLRIPLPAGDVDELEVTVITYHDDSTGVNLTYGTKADTPLDIVSEPVVEGINNPHVGKITFTIPGKLLE